MKPTNITDMDWKLLQEKYPNEMPLVLKKLNDHYPVQYLIGNVQFLDAIIKVNENVLIPRFETELLVVKTVEKIKNFKNPKILELGTGSGCIAISLKQSLKCDVTAIDISKEAILLAQSNALLNHVDISFQVADMLHFDYEQFDVIISNPPYVDRQENVDEETKYEPQNALYASQQGLFFYEQIIRRVASLSQKPKFIAFEIGMTQAKSIQNIVNQYLHDFKLTVEKDLTNRDRYIFIQFV